MDLKTENFVKKAKEIHGDKYDYSKVWYKKAVEKVCIICPEHGEFWQTPHNHITNKAGCPKCCKNHNRYTQATIVEKFKEIHGDKYDYSKVEYVNNQTKVYIVCPKHGGFWQTPNKHIQGRGCPKCGKESTKKKLAYTLENFIKISNEVHNSKYVYDCINDFSNVFTKVPIICPKHGVFWQTPHHHMNGHGCPICNYSKLERLLSQELEKRKITYTPQYGAKWLGRQKLDFYLDDYNVGIECQGEQHFSEVFYRSKNWTKEKREKSFEEIKKRDENKKNKCEKHGVKLLYYSDLKIDYPYFVYTEINTLIEDILNSK